MEFVCLFGYDVVFVSLCVVGVDEKVFFECVRVVGEVFLLVGFYL